MKAQFRILPCGFLGIIVFRDGTHSQTLASKMHAFDIGEALVGLNLNEEEWRNISDQIMQSKLINRHHFSEQIIDSIQGDAAEQLIRNEYTWRRWRREDGEGWKDG